MSEGARVTLGTSCLLCPHLVDSVEEKTTCGQYTYKEGEVYLRHSLMEWRLRKVRKPYRAIVQNTCHSQGLATARSSRQKEDRGREAGGVTA